MLRGIARYEREHGPWTIFHEPRGLDDQVPAILKKWRADGAIVRVQNERIANAVRAMKFPVVDVLGAVEDMRTPLVHVDDSAIARLAADHLLERGFRRFAFYGIRTATWSEHRRRAFIEHIEAAGYPCATFNIDQHPRTTGAWQSEQVRLSRWLVGLSKPTGIMVCTDHRAQRVLEACRNAGIAVPDELAVIGVDNDEPLCEVCAPPLSSVVPNHQQVGYEAAALLNGLISGRRRPDRPICVPPQGIVVRRSTDVTAIDDPYVASGVRFIREHACQGVGLKEVAQHVGLSTNMLQRRFRKAIKGTIHDQIVHVRLARAKQLLSRTDLPLMDVAIRAGFRHQEYMGAVFKARLGTTPARFRASTTRS